LQEHDASTTLSQVESPESRAENPPIPPDGK
jgi:hypothetical protein